MSPLHRHRPAKSFASSKPHEHRLDRRFQMKVTLSLCLGMGGCLLAFLAPALYFIRQNYELFDKLARDVNPTFLSHLEREVRWLESFLLFGTLAVFGVCFYFGLRLTRHLLGPAREVEAQLRRMTEGDWSATPDRAVVREDDTGLLEVADYFSRSLRADAELELKILQSLTVDPGNRPAVVALKNLIEMKRRKLSLPTATMSAAELPDAGSTATSASPASVLPLRRVS